MSTTIDPTVAGALAVTPSAASLPKLKAAEYNREIDWLGWETVCLLNEMVLNGVPAAPNTSRTTTSVAVGASDSGTIPIGKLNWSFTILAGTATFNGAAGLPAGFTAQGTAGTPTATALEYTTDSASSAYVQYDT